MHGLQRKNVNLCGKVVKVYIYIYLTDPVQPGLFYKHLRDSLINSSLSDPFLRGSGNFILLCLDSLAKLTTTSSVLLFWIEGIQFIIFSCQIFQFPSNSTHTPPFQQTNKCPIFAHQQCEFQNSPQTWPCYQTSPTAPPV